MKNNLNLYKKAAQAFGFYDMPIWDGKEITKRPEFDLFIWRTNSLGGRNDYGVLNEKLFDTLEKKIVYLQGIFESYSGSNLKEGILHFANSQKTVERCKKWINEIAKEYLGVWGNGVKERHILYLTPICHSLIINPKIIKFIQDYENKK